MLQDDGFQEKEERGNESECSATASQQPPSSQSLSIKDSQEFIRAMLAHTQACVLDGEEEIESCRIGGFLTGSVAGLETGKETKDVGESRSSFIHIERCGEAKLDCTGSRNTEARRYSSVDFQIHDIATVSTSAKSGGGSESRADGNDNGISNGNGNGSSTDDCQHSCLSSRGSKGAERIELGSSTSEDANKDNIEPNFVIDNNANNQNKSNDDKNINCIAKSNSKINSNFNNENNNSNNNSSTQRRSGSYYLCQPPDELAEDFSR